MAEPRALSQEELPASVLQLPMDLNPLADGIVMAHQGGWIADNSWLKLCVKGRRTGITWAEAQDDSLIAAASVPAGGDNIWYVGDTKDKGLEFVGYCAHFLRFIEGHNATIWEGEEVIRYADDADRDVLEKVASYSIRCKSGHRITALAGRPEVIRGLQGVVVIDEAAYHRNVKAMIDACNALLIWGGRIRIISTHNGVLNAFNELIKETEAGKWDYSLHRYTFDDAVANGLYERVCLVRGWTPTPEGKEEWYKRVRGAYGTRTEAMREELDAIPREGEGRLLPYSWIQAASVQEYVVKRWTPRDEDFIDWPQEARRATIRLWLEQEIAPVLETFPSGFRTALGGDFGMRQDRSAFACGYVGQRLERHVPLLVELWRVPYDQQKQVLEFIVTRLARFGQAVLDANGNGMVLAQEARQKFGQARVTELIANDAWYREHSTQFQAAFADKLIKIPADADVEGDLALMEVVNGVGKVPANVRTDGTEASGGGKRHGDAAVALLNFHAATLSDVPPFDFRALGEPRAARAADAGGFGLGRPGDMSGFGLGG